MSKTYLKEAGPAAQVAADLAGVKETLPGVFLGHKHLPVSSAGPYIPGGRYPLSARSTCSPGRGQAPG